MALRKMSEEYMDKLDFEENTLHHTHQRKVSFEETASIRIFDVKDKAGEYD